jgi:hypothetical protein
MGPKRRQQNHMTQGEAKALKRVEEMYTLVGQDPLAWLEHAQTLKLSADVILQEFLRILPQSLALPGVRERELGYIRAFMLLTALAFENLIKGIFIARNSHLVDRQKLDGKLWSAVRKGHGISTLAQEVISLNTAERHILTRLEEHLIWASRYPIPMNSTQYFQAMMSKKLSSDPQMLMVFTTEDPEVINTLFGRLSALLERTQDQHASS